MGRNRHKHRAKNKKNRTTNDVGSGAPHAVQLDSSNRFHEGYRQALRHYWDGHHQAAIDVISELLMDEPEVVDSQLLYRLWIEALAELEDTTGLRLLRDHLNHLSEAADPFVPALFAMIGLIHFELDEIEAANLVYGSLRQYQDMYVFELKQHLSNRVSLAEKSHKQLLSHREAVVDYLHFQSLARVLTVDGDLQNLNWVFKTIDQVYPGSPLPEYFVMQMRFEEKDYRGALEVAQHLVREFPENHDFLFYAGHTAFKTKQYELAADLLKQLSGKSKGSDPDVFCLLGMVYAQMALKHNDTDMRIHADQYFDRAIHGFKEQGFPITFAKQQKDRLRENFTGTVTTSIHSQKPRYWFIKVPSRTYNELRTAPESEISRISRAMGNQPKSGDICFVFGDGLTHERYSDDYSTWRLGAVYTVASEPVWHPYQLFQSDLILESRPKVSVPMLFQQLDRKKAFLKGKKDKGDPRNFGVLEVDGTAVDAILEELAFFSDVNGELINTLTRLRPA